MPHSAERLYWVSFGIACKISATEAKHDRKQLGKTSELKETKEIYELVNSAYGKLFQKMVIAEKSDAHEDKEST